MRIGLMFEAIAVNLPAEAGGCIETQYDHTVPAEMGWEIHLANGMAIEMEGNDSVFPDEWKAGVEVRVCSGIGFRGAYEITNLSTKETFFGRPTGDDAVPK